MYGSGQTDTHQAAQAASVKTSPPALRVVDAPSSNGHSAAADQPPLHECSVKVGAYPMRCLIAGEGRPLLLCHGFLSSAEEFGGRFRALAQHRKLIIPDLPGNGGSPPMATAHTVEALAASLDELLDGLGIVEFDVAGL